MSEIDDIAKGLAMFRDGLRDITVTNATRDAYKQVKQVNATQQDELNRRTAADAIAKEFSMKMIAAGAPATTIQAGFSAIAPKPLSGSVDYAEQAAITGDTRMADVGNSVFQAEDRSKGLDRDKDLKVAGLAAMAAREKSGVKGMKDARDTSLKVLKEFSTTYKTLVQGLDSAEQGLHNIETSDQPAAINMALISQLRASGDNRISEEDIRMNRINPDVLSSLAREFGVKIHGKSLKEDREVFKVIFKGLIKKNKQLLSKHAEGFGKAQATIDPNMNADDFTNVIKTRYSITDEPTAPAAESMAVKAQQTLTDPNASAVKKQKAQQVLDVLAKKAKSTGSF